MSEDGTRSHLGACEPGVEVGGRAANVTLTARVPAAVLGCSCGVIDYQTVVGYCRLMEVLGVCSAVVVVRAAVGGEHTLVVDLKGTCVGVVVVTRGALSDTREDDYGVGRVPGGVNEVISERRAVVGDEVEVGVSVLCGADVRKTCESHIDGIVDAHVSALVYSAGERLASEKHVCVSEHRLICVEICRDVGDIHISEAVDGVKTAVAVAEKSTGGNLVGKTATKNLLHIDVRILARCYLEHPS